jgi:hypothetical protein
MLYEAINTPMAKNIAQNFLKQAQAANIPLQTKRSREWFRKEAAKLSSVNRRQLMREYDTKGQHVVGSMAMFYYDPKTKAQLPYYDKFPLTVIVGPAEGGFYGLNLHYLPPVLRARFLGELMEVATQEKIDVTYKMLKSTARMSYYKPCLKHYLNSHVRSEFAIVPASHWELVTFLPTAQWAKQSEGAVYRASRKMV